MSAAKPSLTMSECDRVLALLAAQPAIRMWRDGGATWEFIAYKCRKNCNPLGLSPRQLRRIYSGPGQYKFDNLRNVVRRMDRKP